MPRLSLAEATPTALPLPDCEDRWFDEVATPQLDCDALCWDDVTMPEPEREELCREKVASSCGSP